MSQALPFYATETKTTDPTERRIKNVGYARSWEKEKWKLNSLSSGIRIKSDKMIYSEVRMEQVTVQEEQTEQRNPDEKHLVTFDSELRRLKSNKKPLSNTHIPFNH